MLRYRGTCCPTAARSLYKHSVRRRCHKRKLALQCVAAAELSVFSPSKVNLFLRVMRRREDGFHDLASLFHVISLGDDMRFAVLPSGATKDELHCSDPTIPCDERNLVIKALNLYRRKTGRTEFFHVDLQKTVPHGAGLGGGSGNAATTLWAANQLCGGPASNPDLLTWAGEIGSDISVFFSLGAAYCTGRGEVVENVAPPLPLTTPLLLVKPPLGLSTPAIFKALDLKRRSEADPRWLLKEMAESGMSQHVCVNDLEQPAFDTLPELHSLKLQLLQQQERNFDAVFMTGSGSTIVCVGDDRPPSFLNSEAYSDTFISAARLIVRQDNSWYMKP